MIVNEREKIIYQQGFMSGSNAAQAAIKAAEHRAEVAERALDKATELAYEDCSKRWKEELIKQAEKELAAQYGV